MNHDEISLLYPYASERQRIALDAIKKHHTRAAAAEALGINERNLRKLIKRVRDAAALQGVAPECDMTKPAPDTHIVRGTSTLYDEDGNKRLQWVKTDLKRDQQLAIMREACEALVEELPQVPRSPVNPVMFDELMAVYPLGDPHIGMLAWGEETGQDWDLAIAEASFTEVFDRLVKTAPHCKQATIINLGDYFHADNMAGVTERSKHALDMDGRYAKMIRIGVKILRRMIDSALEHHEFVRVINAIGNHDDTGALFLSVALDHMYELEPRVTVDTNPTPFHYVTHGKVLLGVHHGHSCKIDKLPGVMAADQPRRWGEAEHRYWYAGHIHHDSRKEFAGCIVESFRTLAAKDAYATWHGYRAGQDSKCIVLHQEYGEIERHTVNIKQVKGRAA